MASGHGSAGGLEPDRRVLDLLARLIAFDTESRRANVALIDHCATLCDDAGAAVTVLPGEPGRANLLARFGPDAPGGLFVSGHTDVVPAGDGWDTDPYALTERDGTLRGRGTADMKGFVAVALAHLTTELDARRLTAPIHLALSYDEEIGCVGVRGMIDHLRATPAVAPSLVLVGEPTMLQACVAHSGKVSFDVVITAESGHSSRAGRMPSAISVAAEVIRAVDDLPFAYGRRTGIVDPLADVTANVGVIDGGNAVNVIAPRCRLALEMRFGAGVDVDAALAPLWARIEELRGELRAAGGDVAVVAGASYPALATDPHEHAVEALRADVGGEVGTVMFGTEGGLFAECLPSPVVVCGPGSIDVAHRPNELVELAQLAAAREVLATLVARHGGIG